MGKLYIIFIVFFTIQSALAYKCEDQVNKELKLLDMGSIEKPSQCVNKLTSGSGANLEFSNKSKTGNGRIVSVTQINSKQHLKVESPSIILSGFDSKEIILNDACEIDAIQFCFAGDCSRITGEDCNLLKTHTDQNDTYRKLTATKKWASNSLMKEAVETFCTTPFNVFSKTQSPSSQLKNSSPAGAVK